jgi:hypothetical protein
VKCLLLTSSTQPDNLSPEVVTLVVPLACDSQVLCMFGNALHSHSNMSAAYYYATNLSPDDLI